MKIAIGLIVLALAVPAVAQGANRVEGYVRKDGTYVPPHYRTNPDGKTYNNWSTSGNTNPYTGEPGRKDPYKEPSTGSGTYKPYKPKY